MMFRKDRVFWWATGIFVSALVLFWITQSQFWLALGIVSYLLRPTLASLGIGRNRIDERQMTIHYRSGNIAFAVTILMCVIFAVKLGSEGNHDFEMFAMVIVIGLATKALFNVLLVKDPRRSATKILIGVGLLMALFGACGTWNPESIVEVLMNAVPGLAIAGVGFLSRVYPRPAGLLVFAEVLFLLWMIFKRGFGWGQIGTAAIICVPLTLAALCLFTPDKAEGDQSPGTDPPPE